MKHFYKALFLALQISPLAPVFAGNIPPVEKRVAPLHKTPALLKEGYDVSIALLLGFLTGGTCAVTDFASGGKSMPLTWATSFFIRWKFIHSLGDQNSKSESRCSAASLIASWATYGLVMLWLVMKRNPRV